MWTDKKKFPNKKKNKNYWSIYKIKYGKFQSSEQLNNTRILRTKVEEVLYVSNDFLWFNKR